MSHLTSFQQSLTEQGYDAAIVTDKLNVHYLAGFALDDAVVLVLQNAAFLLTDFRYVEAAHENVCQGMQILTPEDSRTDAIRMLLNEHHCERVAVEEDALSLSQFERYRKTFVGVTLEGGASALLSQLRLCKTDDEIAMIARAQDITDAAFDHILKVMTPEMTEIDVALELEMYMRRQGAEGLAFETIAVSGTNSSRPHGVPRPVKLEKGFLTMDFGARLNGYCSDMTRTVVLGRADAEMKKVYETVRTAQAVALEAIREGVGCRALDEAARAVIYGAGYKGCFGHSLGHGVGMYIHEEPRVSPNADEGSVLERGHVVTVEPGIYIAGKYGCRIEDMVAVCNDGSIRNFTKSTKELIELF